MPIINNLSGNEIEILKLADFLTGVEHDVTDVYFGELQIFTVWAEAEGALPLTINANGEALIDYKIYGNLSQNGTPIPSDPIYPSECGERTENLANDSVSKNYTIDDTTGQPIPATSTTMKYWCMTQPINVMNGDTICLSVFDYSRTMFWKYTIDDGNGNVIIKDSGLANGAIVRIRATGFMRIAIYVYNASETYMDDAIDSLMLTEGSTAPTSYIPYGYRVPMYVRGENILGYKSDMSQESNWEPVTYYGTKYFMYYELPESIASSIKSIGRISAKGFLKQGGTYYSGEVFGLTTDKTGNLASNRRILDNDGTLKDYTVDFSSATKLYLAIGLGTGITDANKQTLIDAFWDNYDLSIIAGSTPPSQYIPYSRTDIPIYLGEIPSERYIKKLVLTGSNDERWSYNATYNTFSLIVSDLKTSGLRKTTLSCSHYMTIDDGRPISNVPNNSIYTDQVTSIYIMTDAYTTTTDFKLYLAQQLTNGTPVTIWYPLITPTTAILNEPLRKIGDYVDSVSGTGLPTLNGTTVYDADLATKPSKMYVKYKGK